MDFSFKGIFTSVFRNKKDLQTSTSKLLNLFTPYFADSINPELNDTFMTGVNTHAKHLSKIKPTVYLKDKKDKKWMTKILSMKPNPIMEAGTFWEKVCRNYYIDNNVFIYLDWDLNKPKQPLRSMWILDPTNINVSHIKGTMEFYLQFQLQGDVITTSLDNVVHIPRHVGDTEIFGERDSAINTVLKVINTNYGGIEAAIKTSGFLRFVINTTTLLTDKQKQTKAEDFANTYLAQDGTGIAYLDASSTLTQVNSKAEYANADMMKLFEKKIKDYLNISDEIISAKFSENDWQSYYETNIEPIVNKLQNELTDKLFTIRQYDAGNRVVISSSDLQVISMSSKIAILEKSREIGLMTVNEYRKLFNMDPIEGGETRLVSLNYIDSEKATAYQLSKVKEGGPTNGQE